MRPFADRARAKECSIKGHQAYRHKREIVMAAPRRIAKGLQQQGLTLRQIAVALNEQGHRTIFGKPFTHSTVRGLFAVYQYSEQQEKS